MTYNYLDYVSKRFKNCSLQNYNVTNANKEAFNSCKSFCDEFEKNLDEGNNLLLCGNVGVGKTHLAYAIKRELHFEKGLKQNEIVIVSMMTLLQEIKNSFSNKGKFEDYATYYNAKKCTLLIIDEIGVQYGTEAERIMIYDLFNYRYENMKSTIALSNLPKDTTHLPPDQQSRASSLQKILGLRITDRLCSGSKYVFITEKSKR